MTIAHRNTQTAATTASGAANDTVTITKPTGLALDDYMVHWLMVNNNVGAGSWATPTPPSGFGSPLITVDGGGGGYNKLFVYGKFADAGDVAASNFASEYSEGGSGPYAVIGGISAYSGVDTTLPLDGVTPGTVQDLAGAGNNIVLPTLTPANANPKLIVGIFGLTDGNQDAGSRTITVPGSMTSRGQVVGYTSAYARAALADEAYASAAATGTRTATFAGAVGRNMGVILLLREAPAVPTDPTITDVDTDEIVRNDQTGIVITGTGFSATGNDVFITQPGTEMPVTVTAESTTEITISMVYDSIIPNLKNGPATISVINDADLRSAEFPITIATKTGELYVELASLHSPPEERLTTDPDIDPVTLGQFEFRGASGGAAPVTLIPEDDGTYGFSDGIAVDFQARFFDRVTNTWGEWAVIYAEAPIDPEVPVDPVDPEAPTVFTSLSDQALQAVVESNTVVVAGILVATGLLTVAGGSASVNGGPFDGGTQVVQNGDTIQVRHITSNKYRTSVSTLVQYGGNTYSFTSTTRVRPPQGGFNLLKKFYRRWRS